MNIVFSSMRIFFSIGIFLIAGFTILENKPLVVENKKAALTYHLAGGALKDFHLKPNGLNPFSGYQKARGNAHLSVTAKPDPNIVVWELVDSPILKNRNMEFMMKADFLKEKITVERHVKFGIEKTGFYVKEDFLNYDIKEKIIEHLQQIALNPELIKGSRIYSNIEVKLPEVSSFESTKMFKKVKGESLLNWIVIANASKNLMFGYIWAKDDYAQVAFKTIENVPFLSLRDPEEEQKPLESKGQRSKSYFCFLQEISEGFDGISSIEPENGRIILETAAGKRKLDLGPTDDLY